MKAGRLDQRVTIERVTIDFDEIGGTIETWAPLVATWAAIEPLNGREFFAAATTLAEVTTRIRVRYRPGITSVDRVEHDGRLHNILAIIDPKSGERELVLMCKAYA